MVSFILLVSVKGSLVLLLNCSKFGSVLHSCGSLKMEVMVNVLWLIFIPCS